MLKHFTLFAVLVTAAACSSKAEMPGPNPMADLSQITPEQWQALSQRTVYFGHQSVGANIVEGVREIAAEKRADSAARRFRQAGGRARRPERVRDRQKR